MTKSEFAEFVANTLAHDTPPELEEAIAELKASFNDLAEHDPGLVAIIDQWCEQFTAMTLESIGKARTYLAARYDAKGRRK